MSNEPFDRILKWIKLINQKPNFECPFFYLSDNGKAVILDLANMRSVPEILRKFSEKEKAFLFIDLTNNKTVRYYAFDICSNTQTIIDESGGDIMFSLLEDDILKYIEDNISEITKYDAPFSKLMEMNKDEYTRPMAQGQTPVTPPQSRNYDGYKTDYKTDLVKDNFGRGNYHHNNYNNNNYAYNSTQYKERELFTNTLYAHVKNGRTALATDYIYEFINKYIGSDKDLINNICRFLTIDKLDLISLKELIKATEPIKDDLSERLSLITKFKANVIKANPKKYLSILKEIEANA